jgi:hypothetical protein
MPAAMRSGASSRATSPATKLDDVTARDVLTTIALICRPVPGEPPTGPGRIGVRQRRDKPLQTEGSRRGDVEPASPETGPPEV